MGVSILKKIAVVIEKKQNSIFSYPVKKQEGYLKHFNFPIDEIERGYFQYCCQMRLYGKAIHYALNLVALPMSMFYLIKYRKESYVFEHNENCVFFRNGLPNNIIPNSLKNKHTNIFSVADDIMSLTEADMFFLKSIFKRYPFSWMLWLKTILNVARYSATISKYNPSVILACNEFSYTSSILTKYCRMKGVKHINIMHGEKLFYMRDSFVCYDEYYVWNQYYADLLIELGAETKQFKIESQDALIIPPDVHCSKEYDFTYYLASESKEILNNISGYMRILQENGYKVAVRPHPRYSNSEEIAFIFKDIEIEDYKKLSIEKSLLRTRNAISLYSTVLNQAYHNGISVVIDDMSNPDGYKKLEELRYVMLRTAHFLLSSFVEE